MAGDAGENVSAADWSSDASARLSPRVAITATDPLSAGQQAWVYTLDGVAIDGMTDAITAMPHVDWFQVNGG